MRYAPARQFTDILTQLMAIKQYSRANVLKSEGMS